jgi:hypothetical protein
MEVEFTAPVSHCGPDGEGPALRAAECGFHPEVEAELVLRERQ